MNEMKGSCSRLRIRRSLLVMEPQVVCFENGASPCDGISPQMAVPSLQVWALHRAECRRCMNAIVIINVSDALPMRWQCVGRCMVILGDAFAMCLWCFGDALAMFLGHAPGILIDMIYSYIVRPWSFITGLFTMASWHSAFGGSFCYRAAMQ